MKIDFVWSALRAQTVADPPPWDMLARMAGGALDMDHIRSALQTRRVGRRIEYLPSTTSTNDAAWQWMEKKEDDSDGLVILAEYQSTGRGRHGRTWQSPCGASLHGSILLMDRGGEFTGGEIALLAAVAAYDAVAACTDVAVTIKWPNDLLVHGRKLGGILIESRQYDINLQAYVIGIGINCLQQAGHFPFEWSDRATSLEMESPGRIDRSSLVVALLVELDRWLADPAGWNYEDLRNAWLARAEPMGRRIHIEHAGKQYSGSVIDLDPAAALVVQLDEGGVRAFNAADTTVVFPS